MLRGIRSFYYIWKLVFSVGFVLFSNVCSQIPLGSKLSALGNNCWVSSNENFAFGFFKRLDQYSIGIRFNSDSIPIQKQTMIWVAGGHITAGNESYFELTKNGELVFSDSKSGTIVWTSNTSNVSASQAILLDNGNLVLHNKKREIVWQTFDTPTDTLVPDQNLSGSQFLRASSRNSLSSYYALRMEGYLELRWETNVVYWKSGSHSQSVLQTILKSDGTQELRDKRSDLVWAVFAEDHDDPNIKFRFLRLDVDGNLRLYSWVEISKMWEPVWEAIGNQCDVFATCGSRGICAYNSSGSPICKCPFLFSIDSTVNCLVPYNGECKSCAFVTRYNNTFLYGIYSPNETITRANLQQCVSLCEDDPFCFAATFMNERIAQCRIMKIPYITGQSGPSIRSISFVKSCSDPIAALPLYPSSPSSSPTKVSMPRVTKVPIYCLVGLSFGILLVLTLLQFGVGLLWFYSRRLCDIKKKFALEKMALHPNSLIALSFSDIKKLSENFKQEIGPNMFKGMLPNKNSVAVKVLKTTMEGREFRKLILTIGSIYHRNLLQLMGYCCESDHKILVYEFAKYGSLRRCLEDPKLTKRLTWEKRMKICINVAKGISYLHSECREFISHGNLNCEKVLLEENFEAKVSEFGLECIQGEGSESSNLSGGGEAKDVKDFSKLVLKLVCGQGEADDVFFQSVFENWKRGWGDNVVDRRLDSEVRPEELELVLRSIFWCLQIDERMRPSMQEVVKVLEGTSSVDIPPSPFMCPRSQEEKDSQE